MKLADYIGSLLPMFGKSRITDDIICLEKELKEQLLPPLKNVVNIFGKRKFKSEWNVNFNKLYMDNVKPKGNSGNFYQSAEDVMEIIADNIPVISRLVDDYYADDVLKEAMTVIRANILQYVETMTFAIRYTGRLLVLSMSLEEEAVSNGEISGGYTQGELKWITDNTTDYFSAMMILSGTKGNLDGKFRALPDMSVNSDNIDTTTAVIGKAKMDPFSFGFIGVKFNPIYHVRIAIAEWEVANYKAAKERRNSLELKLMHLKTLDSGKNDAKLQQQIDYTQGRIDTLNASIVQMEKDYG